MNYSTYLLTTCAALTLGINAGSCHQKSPFDPDLSLHHRQTRLMEENQLPQIAFAGLCRAVNMHHASEKSISSLIETIQELAQYLADDPTVPAISTETFFPLAPTKNQFVALTVTQVQPTDQSSHFLVEFKNDTQRVGNHDYRWSYSIPLHVFIPQAKACIAPILLKDPAAH